MLAFIPGVQVLMDVPFLDTAKEIAGDRAENLFTYYLPYSGKIGLGYWISSLSGVHHEITSWDVRTGPTRNTVNFVRYWLSERRVRDTYLAGKRKLSELKAARNERWSLSKARQDARERLRKRSSIHFRDHPIWKTGKVQVEV